MAPSVADRLPWAPTLDAALQSAAAAHKLVLLYLRGACGNCNDAPDAFLAEAAGHESVRQAMSGFVPMRADVPAAPQPGDRLADWIRVQKVPAPALIAVGPDGTVATLWGTLTDVALFANDLSAVKQETDPLFRAAELRAAGRTDEAELALGTALLRAGDTRRAQERLEHAAELARANGNPARAEQAEMNLAFALSNAGDSLRGLQLAQKIVRSPASRDNEAAAWVVVGSMKRAMKDGGGAVEAYRHAYEIAPPKSEAEATAMRYLERFDKQPLPPKLAILTGAVTLVAPQGSSLSGKQPFSAKTQESVRRVELFFDERSLDALEPPFSTTIDLGPAGRAHVIRAVARDENGKLLGEDSITVNAGVQALDVKLIAPLETVNVSGPTVVEATAAAPLGHEIKRVQLFWNETVVASLPHPPYRASIDIPAGRTGYVRAVAVLDDGRMVEDTKLINAAGASEAMSVEGVALYARVLDAGGAPIRGLATSDFRVRDEGAAVKATIRPATDDPLTVGIVVDTSGSMGSGMLELKESAARFLRETITPADQAFAVSFDIAPRLLHPLSRDTSSLTRALYDLHAGGDTSVYDALVYSLQQFQSTGGRKALIVFTDGVDQASRETAAAASRLARQSGVPIWVVLMLPPPAAATTANDRRAGTSAMAGLREIVDATGGAIVTSPTVPQLAALFASIREQLRGEYLVTYTPSAHSGAAWRRVTIEVPDRGAVVRAINGYFEK
jgi:VWFA-related protein